MFRIVYQRAKCIGCHACAEAAPYRWRVSRKDGRATLVGGELRGKMYMANISADEYEANLAASQNCPARIIRIEEK